MPLNIFSVMSCENPLETWKHTVSGFGFRPRKNGRLNFGDVPIFNTDLARKLRLPLMISIDIGGDNARYLLSPLSSTLLTTAPHRLLVIVETPPATKNA